MLSTIDTELDWNTMTVIPKSYPNWYGFADIGFIWHGEWADPELEFDGRQFNVHLVEDALYDCYCEYRNDDSDIVENNDDAFDTWVYNNPDLVHEYCEYAVNMLAWEQEHGGR